MDTARIIAEITRTADNFDIVTPKGKTPVIIVLSGLPGTGKTYFCRRLTEHLPYVILESDALRKKMFPQPAYSSSETASLFRTIDYLTELLLKKGVSVIHDATNLAERHRKTIYHIAEGANARVILVSVEAPPELVKERLNARAERRGANDYSDADWTVYQRMKTGAEKISRPHFTVDTSRDIMPIIEKIVKEANR